MMPRSGCPIFVVLLRQRWEARGGASAPRRPGRKYESPTKKPGICCCEERANLGIEQEKVSF